MPNWITFRWQGQNNRYDCAFGVVTKKGDCIPMRVQSPRLQFRVLLGNKSLKGL